MNIVEMQITEDKLYLFVGIDGTSKLVIVQLDDKAARRTVW